MGGSKKKKNGDRGEKKKDGGSDGTKGRGNKSQTGGGHNPTERRDSNPHTEAKRPRTKSAQRKTGKFVDTFQEVADPQTPSDATTSQTRRVTRSQTRSESTTSSPVKGDPRSVSSSQTTAIISEHSNQGSRPLNTEEDQQSFFESAHASFDEADRRLEAAFDANRVPGDQFDSPLKRTSKLPRSKPTTVLKQSTASDETIVKGVWTEKDLLEDTARTSMVSSEVSSQGDPRAHTEDDEWGIGADVPTPPPERSDNSNDLELQSEVGSSPPRTVSEEGEISDSEEDVMEINAPAPPMGKKPTHTYGDKQRAQTSGDQPRSSNVSDNQRAPAPQRAKGGPGHQSREKSAQEQLDAIRRMTQNDAKNKFDQYHFLIDTHVHMMEYTGRYFRNAKTYRQWSLPFRQAGIPFAFGIEIQHDPAIWSAADSQMFRSPVSYVRDGYGHIMPAGKYPLCGVACHPKFSAPKFDQQFYGAERIQAELEKTHTRQSTDRLPRHGDRRDWRIWAGVRSL